MAGDRNFGKPSAAKRGRNPLWPYVPIIADLEGCGKKLRTEQVRGKAFATRDEAVAYAGRLIEARKADWARKLANPNNRALRAAEGIQ